MSDISEKVQQLESELASLREAVETILNSGMKEKTVLILLKHYTGLTQRDIKLILHGIQNLESEFFGDA